MNTLGALLGGIPTPRVGERGWKHCLTTPPGGGEGYGSACVHTNKPGILFSRWGRGPSHSARSAPWPLSIPWRHQAPSCPGVTAQAALLPGVPFPPRSAPSRKPPRHQPQHLLRTPGPRRTAQGLTTQRGVCLPHRAVSPVSVGTESAVVSTMSPKSETIPPGIQ